MYIVRYSKYLTVGYRSDRAYNEGERLRELVLGRHMGDEESLCEEFLKYLINADVDFEIVQLSEIPIWSTNDGKCERRVFSMPTPDGQDARPD